jgi:GAF domain-containing protein
MIVGDKVIGMIALYDLERERAYDKQDLQVFSSMASQAAIAIDNATLYYEVNRQLVNRVQDLSALNAISQILTSGIRLQEDKILELIYEQAQELTGADDLYIALYDEESQEISFGLATERGRRVNYESRKADMDERGKTEEVIFSREPILHSTLAESRAWYGKKGRKEFIGKVQSSFLGVPMIVGDKVIGMIALYDWERERAYDKQDLQVFSSMASQAAIAIDNIRLVQQQEERGDALELLNQVSEKINATLNLNEVMASIVEGAMRLTGASSGVVHLLKENELSLERSFGYPKGFEHPVPRLDQPDSMTRTIIEDGELIFRQKSEEYQLHSEIVKEGVESIIGAPLILQGVVVGVLYLNFDHQYSFGEEVRTWLDTLTEQAAVATDKIRLYETLE